MFPIQWNIQMSIKGGWEFPNFIFIYKVKRFFLAPHFIFSYKLYLKPIISWTGET